jgi:chemosensory pili system protein ChpA (sensor histidine kinase/response regulator)
MCSRRWSRWRCRRRRLDAGDGIAQTAAPPTCTAPSAETIQLSQATTEEVDAELLEIFLEEADEVLASIGQNFQLLKERLHDTELLTAIRRSVHTLKGSGRMVGLKDLGEAAWAIEQVLNLWLRQEQQVTPALLDLIGQTRTVFVAWVEYLKTGHGNPPDATGMLAAAELLRLGSEAAEPLQVSGALVEPIGSAAEATAAPLPADAGMPTDGELQATEDDRKTRPRLSLAADLAEIFNAEAGAHLATLQREFSLLEANPVAPASRELYRAAHTLAGIGATVGIVAVNQLSHALEAALLRHNHAVHADSPDALATIREAIAELALMLADVAGEQQPEAIPALVEALDALYLEPSAEQQARSAAADEAPAPAPSHPAKPAPAAPEPAPTASAGGMAVEVPPLQDELDEQLLPLFVEEALELNQGIATCLRAWRSNPSDGEIARRLARLFHTLKGSARMAGAMNLGELTHAIETRMDEAQRTGAVPPEMIDDIDNTFDVIVQIVDKLQRGESLDPLVEVPDDATSATAMEAAVGVDDGAVAVDRGAAASPEGDTEATEQRAILRVRADLIDRLVNEAGELSIARSRIEGETRAMKASLLDLTENVIRLRRQLRDIELHAELQMQSSTAQTDERHTDFDPLEFDRFTRFQELTRMMAESVNDVATAQQSLLKNLDDANAAILAQSRLNRDLQQELMSIRMVPFGSIVDRLYRIVRQAGKEIGKRANLEISGAQLELDRTVLDKMLAPLEHMLRNAVAHGLEAADVRLAQGKPEIGEISVTLAQEGNEVILSFADDGAGLDLERLRQRGLAARLLTEDEAADPNQVVELIFAPGISTAGEVSRLSGRGIGMDVVKSEVASLGGRIDVISRTGLGTTFRLYLPLTLAVTKALLVRSGSREYAIPSALIEQVLDTREKGLARMREASVAEWSGRRYPFHYLPHLLGDSRALPEKHHQYWVLLLRSGTGRIALQVDGLIGNQEIVVKNIGPQLARVMGVDGATVLGNGQVLLILNPVALASRTRGTPPGAAGAHRP